MDQGFLAVQLLGRQFQLVTDHQPLLRILGQHQNVPQLAAARLQRWALLAPYSYSLEFKSTDEVGAADALSRLSHPPVEDFDDEAAMFFAHQLEELSPSVTAAEVASETAKDTVLSEALRRTTDGWRDGQHDRGGAPRAE